MHRPDRSRLAVFIVQNALPQRHIMPLAELPSHPPQTTNPLKSKCLMKAFTGHIGKDNHGHNRPIPLFGENRNQLPI